MAIAYGSLTVLDLVDTATYIYYATDEAGSGAEGSFVPGKDLNYVGFYSGPSFSGGRPIPGEENFEDKWGCSDFQALVAQWEAQNLWSGWQNRAGERGVSCTEVVYYARSDNGEHPPADLATEEDGMLEPFEVVYQSFSQEEAAEGVLQYRQGATYSFSYSEGVLSGEKTTGEIVFFSVAENLSLSGHPSIWHTYVPSYLVPSEKWLWTKHIREYTDGRVDIWYNVTKDGEDGRGIDNIKDYYCVTKTSYCDPPSFEDGEVGEDDYEDGRPYEDPITKRPLWYTSAPPTTAVYKFAWNYEIVTYTDGSTKPSTPILIAQHAISFEAKYLLSKTLPNIIDNDVSGWFDTPPSPEDGKRLYMTQKMSNEKDWSSPVQVSAVDGRAGVDGGGIEFVYYLSDSETAPGAPSKTGSTLSPAGWTDSPSGVTEEKKYEYMSQRTYKIQVGGTEPEWGNFSTPILWSKWGERGLDGDSVEYRFQLSTSKTTAPLKPTYDSGKKVVNYGNWTENPSGVTADDPYEYVVLITTTPTGVTISDPVIWSRWGAGVKIKGTAYVPGTVDETWNGKPYELYSHEDCKEINKITKNIQEGDSYIVQGYLFTYSGTGVTFVCTGEIQGPRGYGVTETVVQYCEADQCATPPTSGWGSRPAEFTPGTYLWIWTRFYYNEGDYTDSYSVTYQGTDGLSYIIETSAEEVAYFYADYEDKLLETSPSIISFELYNYPRQTGKQIDFSETYRFGFVKGDGEFCELKQGGLPDFTQFGTYLVNGEETQLINTKTLYFKVGEFLSYIRDYKPQDEGAPTATDSLIQQWKAEIFRGQAQNFSRSVVFRLEYLNNKQNVLALKTIFVREGTPADNLRFSQTASQITMAIQNSKMHFDANGLHITGAGFEMWNAPEDEGGFKTLYADGSGDLHISGIVEAKDGIFHGKIEATDASFAAGTIGGFEIKSDQLVSVLYTEVGKDELDPTQEYYTYDEEKEEYKLDAPKYGSIDVKDLVVGKWYFVYQQEAEAFVAYQHTEDSQVLVPYQRVFEGDSYFIKSTPIIFNGERGEIVAKNISLGDGAKIVDKLAFNNSDGEEVAYIYNPEVNQNKFISAENIEIKTDGTAKFGGIAINGSTSSMYGETGTWSITPERANFKNATIRGTIDTSVFNVSSTQAVGSAMLFMPSYKIAQVIEERCKLILEEDPPTVKLPGEDEQYALALNPGTKFWLVFSDPGREYILCRIEKITSREIIFTQLTNVPDGASSPWVSENVGGAVAMIVLGRQLGVWEDGKIESFNIHAESVEPSSPAEPIGDIAPHKGGFLVFGANGGYSAVADDYVYPRGLTIAEYGTTGLPNLFLGDLTQLRSSENETYSGYGLYSDNVYLKGALTTSLTDDKYAGVNTTHAINATKFSQQTATDGSVLLEADSSRIVFWGGATSSKVNDIQDAPFQVTENGSVYASQAYLANSVFTDGKISGADIYAARLHGSGDGTKAALSIYDAYGGISFRTKLDTNGQPGNDKEIFAIKQDGLHTSSSQPLKVDGAGKVIIDASEIKTPGVNQYLSLTNGSFGLGLQHFHSEDRLCGFYFSEGSTRYQFIDPTKSAAEQKDPRMIWNLAETKVVGTFTLSHNAESTNFQYRAAKSGGGYDLYVTAE